MPTFRSFAEFGRAIERMDRDEKNSRRRITKQMLERAQRIAYEEGRRDVGHDLKFEGWRPRLDLVMRVRPDVGVLQPTRSSAGPWTVAEQGRNQGNANGFAGPGINVRTGVTARRRDGTVRRVRTRQARRWNGYTQGKRTASRATTRINRALPDVAQAEFLKVLKRHVDVT